MTLSLSNHLAADSAAPGAAPRRLRRSARRHRNRCRPNGSTTRSAATCSTRSPGCPSTTRPAPRRRSCATHAAEIAAASGADTLVELGSGTSEKTRLLLDALRDARIAAPVRPVRRRRQHAAGGGCGDPARSTRASRSTPSAAISRSTSARSPRRAGGWWCSWGPRSATSPRARAPSSWPRCPTRCSPGDTLLLGTDLVKDTGRLVRAYDDSAGRDGAVQPQCARGGQPGTRRRLRPRRLRPCRQVERRRGAHRDVAAGQARAAGARRRRWT